MCHFILCSIQRGICTKNNSLLGSPSAVSGSNGESPLVMSIFSHITRVEIIGGTEVTDDNAFPWLVLCHLFLSLLKGGYRIFFHRSRWT